jgi:transcription-repair coupling factor (superfamily II helicase)
LKEFSDLGAGFKIAALDLELRGAGNMLGGEQSGHIEAVGFEMYTSMLEHAVNELKGEEQPQRASTQLNLGISLRIDENYIEEENQRLRIYKKIAGALDEGGLSEIRAELEDRYGELPASVVHLLDAANLRLLCERTGVAQVDRKRDQIHIRFTSQASVDPGRLMKLVAQNAKKGAQFTPQGVLRFPLKATEPREVLDEIRALLEELAAREDVEVAAPHQRR